MSLYTYRVTSLEELSDTLLRVVLAPTQEPIAYLAGQYVELSLSRGIARPFSIANAPREDHCLEFHIRHHQANPFSEELVSELKEARSIQLTEAKGHCVLPSSPKHLIMLAYGTGFAPMKSLIEACETKLDALSLTLLWEGRETSDLYMQSYLQDLCQKYPNFSFVPFVNPTVDEDNTMRQLGDMASLNACSVFVAGPPDWAGKLKAKWLTMGLKAEQFFSDMA